MTSVNGIREATSMHMPWFALLLQEALVMLSNGDSNDKSPIIKDSLPMATNAHFRQLDHVIATFYNEEFATLYKLLQTACKQPTRKNRPNMVAE